MKASKINQLIEQGSEDAKRYIGNVKDALDLQKNSANAIAQRNEAVAKLDDDFLIE
ncbi:MAG: hypothetical protein QM500_07220 [Methylococcales bacterium]